MQHRLHGLRGKAYVAAYKQILADEGIAIAQKFADLVSRDGKFTLRSLGELCNHFRLPVTLMDDCLPSLTNGAYPTGAWERSGCTAKQIGVNWDGK